MDVVFATSLPTGDENMDFRVLADEGGYADTIAELYRRPHGRLQVMAQRDHTRILVEVTVIRDQIARDGNLFCFDGFVGEFLRPDGTQTGIFVVINTLSIDPVLAQAGQTVGVLKMKQISPIPSAP